LITPLNNAMLTMRRALSRKPSATGSSDESIECEFDGPKVDVIAGAGT
jgi:hypothetical protein